MRRRSGSSASASRSRSFRPALGSRVGPRSTGREPDVQGLDPAHRPASPPVRRGVGDDPQQPGAERARGSYCWSFTSADSIASCAASSASSGLPSTARATRRATPHSAPPEHEGLPLAGYRPGDQIGLVLLSYTRGLRRGLGSAIAASRVRRRSKV